MEIFNYQENIFLLTVLFFFCLLGITFFHFQSQCFQSVLMTGTFQDAQVLLFLYFVVRHSKNKLNNTALYYFHHQFPFLNRFHIKHIVFCKPQYMQAINWMEYYNLFHSHFQKF